MKYICTTPVFIVILCCSLIGGRPFVSELRAQGIEVVNPIKHIRPTVTSVMQSEPIPITLSFDDSVYRSGSYSTDMSWCKFELRQRGNIVTSWTPQRHQRSGFYTVPVFARSEQEGLSNAFLSGNLTNVPPGKYELIVQVIKQNVGNSEDKKNKSASPQFTATIRIEPMDQITIRRKVAGLRERLLSSLKREDRTMLMRELAWMPASEAARSWRTLLLDTEVKMETRYLFADALADTGSKAAVDTLIYVQFTNPIRREDGQIVHLFDMIEGIRMSAPPELKDYIKSELAKRRGSIYYRSPSID